MWSMKLIFILFFFEKAFFGQQLTFKNCENDQNKKYKAYNHVNVVLFGATGSLAQKYLWKALYKFHELNSNRNTEFRFSIYALGRKNKQFGRKFISKYFLNFKHCENEKCKNIKKSFFESIQYAQVTSIKNFTKLAEIINENTQTLYGLKNSALSYEQGRLFYLAIPPTAYSETIRKIHQHLLPTLGNAWVRIGFEKPIGNNLTSFKQLMEMVSQYFKETQIFIIDHYLGKSVVKEILPFRIINKDSLQTIWNKNYIEKIEIVCKEKEDLRGRTGFYNEEGVIRDMMQSHMSQLFSLIAMDIPEKGGPLISQIIINKAKLLNQTYFLKKNGIILGQYSSYNAEWLAENGGTNQVTDTPTFAATTLFVNNSRWEGVPFVFVSGKKMDEKSSYVRVIFRNSNEHDTMKQIFFSVGGTFDEIIAVSKNLFNPNFKSNWKKLERIKSIETIFGQKIEMMHIYKPKVSNDPYVELFDGILHGARHIFVTSDFMVSSWKIWDSVISKTHLMKPRKYFGNNKDPSRIMFDVSPEGIHYIEKETIKSEL